MLDFRSLSWLVTDHLISYGGGGGSNEKSFSPSGYEICLKPQNGQIRVHQKQRADIYNHRYIRLIIL